MSRMLGMPAYRIRDDPLHPLNPIPILRPSIEHSAEAAQIVKHFVKLGRFDAGLPPCPVAFAKQDEVVIVLGLAQPTMSSAADRTIGDRMSQHVVLDQPSSALGDGFVKCFETGVDVIVGVDALADIVQQSGKEELFVVGQLVACVVKDLHAMVQRVAFGVIF